VSEAIAKEARSRGVEITTAAEVLAVRVKGGRVSGVALRDGTEIEASAVAARSTEASLPQDARAGHARRRVPLENRALALRLGSFRMNVALSELPDFTSAPGKNAQPHHSSGIIIAPSLVYMERAYFDARTQGYAREPIVEMLIPSTVDRASRRLENTWRAFLPALRPGAARGRSWTMPRKQPPTPSSKR